MPVIAAGAPPKFKGREENWSPEHLFVASMNSCYVLILLAIAEFSKVSIISLSSTACGKLEKVQGGGYQITEISVKPRIVISSVNDLTRMPRILEKAKENFRLHLIKSIVKLASPLSARRILGLYHFLVGTKAARGYSAYVPLGNFSPVSHLRKTTLLDSRF